MLRGAFIGFGNVARHGHVPRWLAREDVEIVAAADVSAEGRAALAERFPAARWHGSFESLLDSEKLDFVDICTPPAHHAEAIQRALERGLHVLCEKPLVLTMAELDLLAALARRGERVLATVHNWRRAPILARATELVAAGTIGEIRRCRWETLRDRPAAAAGSAAEGNWRVDPAVAGGGILIDHGWHALYMIQSWVPREAERVSCRLENRRFHHLPIEDTAEVVLEFPPGPRHSEESLHRQCHSERSEESAPATASYRSRSLTEIAPRATSANVESHEGRSLASLGMTSGVEGLGMTREAEGLGTTKTGARCEIFLTWTAAERANRVLLDGTRGSIAIDGGSLEISGEPCGPERFASLSEGSHHPDWFGGVIEEFLGEIREPSRRGRSLAEAQRCLRWIHAAQESSRRGGEPSLLADVAQALQAVR